MITTPNPVSSYGGTGAATTFPYIFPISDKRFLSIVVTDSNGIPTTLTVDVDYTVNGVGQDNAALWTITYPVLGSPLPVGSTLTISPNLPLLQSKDFENQGGFFAKDFESTADALTLIDQQQQVQLDRAIKIPVGSTMSVDPDTVIQTVVTSSAAAEAAAVAAAASASAASGTASLYAACTGTNVYVGTAGATIAALSAGLCVLIQVPNTNTGIATFNLNALGAKNITKLGSTPLTAGDLVAGTICELVYDGAQWQIVSLLAPGATATASAASTIRANLTSGSAVATDNTFISTRNALDTPLVTVGSAATVDLGAAASAYVGLTGNNTVTSFGTGAAGIVRKLVFLGTVTLAYSNSAIILPGSQNISAAIGDTAIFVSEGSGLWRCLCYTKSDGTALAVAAGSNAQARGYTIVTSSGSWTVPVGVTSIKATAVGGGGGGGGNSTATGTSNRGGGGGSGAVVVGTFTVAPGASVPCTVGAAGTGTTGNGNTGGTTSFNSTLSAGGGAGGSVGISSGGAAGGAGGAASGGTLNLSGFSAGFGMSLNGGAPTPLGLGDGGIPPITPGSSSPSAGNAGQGYGSGGSGAVSGSAASAVAGGNGAPGIILIEW